MRDGSEQRLSHQTASQAVSWCVRWERAHTPRRCIMCEMGEGRDGREPQTDGREMGERWERQMGERWERATDTQEMSDEEM